ncbi:zinc-binding dehydrogenase [Coniochaeta ligniaria NRRL 30616]|uniref:Zinc-binding dehydrogenase n=1 Tax=Coniochaeta ligniaria NRRL 30616 TaxID=1408157 RepID=A0A1J7J6I6_9PEZI|nr:zinc-binding dehydrogenase [Coniochaeta ligniaria NRRL 30616]
MAGPLPRTSMQWTVSGGNGLDSLKYAEQPLPDLGDNEVLVKIQGASLNYRDLIIAKGEYPWEVKDGVVPGSDGAGTVLSTGKHVTRFQPGDKVVTMLLPKNIGGPATEKAMTTSLGANIDGTLRTVGVFDEQGLVAMPKGLSFVEAATLSCAGVTAWNALFGLPGRPLMAGQWVLTQGTGGVSTFAVQFAKAVGARVIATTSTDGKAKLLKGLGADHVINYREDVNWGATAKQLTGGSGVDIVVEVTGPSSLKQSVASVKLDGIISVVGFVGGTESKEPVPTLLDAWAQFFTARGLWVGNRIQMEEMCRAIEAKVHSLRPIIDPKIFTLDQLKEAYEYMSSGKNQGKVCIKIAD